MLWEGRPGLPRSREGIRRPALAAAAFLLASPLLAGCVLFGDDEGDGASVFDVEPGQCFAAQEKVEAQISDVEQVDCGEPHAQEAYAAVGYEAPAETGGDAYPGDEALDAFAEGACAEEFGPYVGVDYLDSDLFFTYLVPSARSWQEDDRTVLCFVTSAGEPLVGSVKGSAR